MKKDAKREAARMGEILTIVGRLFVDDVHPCFAEQRVVGQNNEMISSEGSSQHSVSLQQKQNQIHDRAHKFPETRTA